MDKPPNGTRKPPTDAHPEGEWDHAARLGTTSTGLFDLRMMPAE